MVAAAGVLALKMVIAAFSGMGAATFCHPLDVIRVQMQTEGSQFKGVADCASQVIASEGFVKGLYAGIGAAYLRQWLLPYWHLFLLVGAGPEQQHCCWSREERHPNRYQAFDGLHIRRYWFFHRHSF
jgi:hypothetical protein